MLTRLLSTAFESNSYTQDNTCFGYVDMTGTHVSSRNAASLNTPCEDTANALNANRWLLCREGVLKLTCHCSSFT